MKILILICIIFISVCNLTQLYTQNNECKIDKSLWCKNLANIIECEALEYCNKHFLEIEDESCGECIAIVKRIQEEVKMGTTRTSIRLMLEYLCNQKLQSIYICELIVNHYIVTVFSLLKLNMDSNSVCNTLLFCKKRISCFSGPQNMFLTESNEDHDNYFIDFEVNVRELIIELCSIATINVIDTLKCYKQLTINPRALSKLIDDNLVNEYFSCPGLNKNIQKDSCGKCKFLVKIIRDTLLNNQSFPEFVKSAQKICLKLLDTDHYCNGQNYLFKFIYSGLKIDRFEIILCNIIYSCNIYDNETFDNIQFQ